MKTIRIERNAEESEARFQGFAFGLSIAAVAIAVLPIVLEALVRILSQQ